MAEPPPEHLPASWDATAETYERVFDPFTRQYAEEALRLTGLKAGERALDIAAGTGSLTIAAAGLGAEVVAADFSPGMTERLRARIAREGLSGVRAEVMDGQALHLPDDGFDCAYSVFGMMFFARRDKGFSEMRRVLRPGGRGAVVVWGPPERMTIPPYLRAALTEAVPDFRPPPSPSWQELQHPEVFAEEMRAAGFAKVAIHTVTRTWRSPSPAWLWENIQGFSPLLAPLFKRLGAEVTAATGEVFQRILREKFGEGPVELTGEAHIGVCVK